MASVILVVWVVLVVPMDSNTWVLVALVVPVINASPIYPFGITFVPLVLLIYSGYYEYQKVINQKLS